MFPDVGAGGPVGSRVEVAGAVSTEVLGAMMWNFVMLRSHTLSSCIMQIHGIFREVPNQARGVDIAIVEQEEGTLVGRFLQ